ncbi:MAG: carbohydrate kinase [Clostridiales bacterium]|nr:carbohydrate kinase [Candidatus Equinaster intestinalis]
MRYDVVAIGEMLIDFASVSKDSEGYSTLAAHPGGAPANFLAVISKFGGRTALIGKVGDDTFGHLLLGTLENNGIDTKGMQISKDFFTTLAFVTFDEFGDRSFAFSRKPGADTQLCIDEIDLKMIDEARVFHFGTLSLTDEPAKTATYKTVEYAKKSGKLITFDPNLREMLWKDLNDAKKQMLWGLTKADVVKISDNEVEFLFGLSPEEGAKHILENFGVKIVFVTCGADGCVFANAKAFGSVPGIKNLNVIDTCGAGDIFGGSAVWKMLQYGKNPGELEYSELKEIASFACTVAGLSTERSGGITSIPLLDEVNCRNINI